MKQFIYSFIISLLAMSACQKHDLSVNFYEETLQAEKLQPSTPEEEAVVEKFAKMFHNSLSKNKRSTRNDSSKISIEKINITEKDELWVANYPDGGYVVMSYGNKTFPIVRFDTCGQFHYDQLSWEGKNELRQTLANSAKRDALTKTSSDDASLWDYFLLENDKDSDTTYMVEFEFFADKLLPDSSVVSNSYPVASTQSEGGIERWLGGRGTIPFRSTPNGYPTIIPLLSMNGMNRQWTIYSPYCYDMPMQSAVGPPAGSGPGHAWLHSLTVCFALLIDNYDYFSWRTYPDVQTQNTSTKLTRFLRQLSDDIGCKTDYYTGCYLTRPHFSGIIPKMMPKYGFIEAYPTRYDLDTKTFETLKNHLSCFNPIILLSFGTNIVTSGESTYIFDGVSELLVRVKVTQSFLDFPISTRYRNYYMDYLHVVSPYDHADDGWWLYDACCTGDDYVYLMDSKY